MFSLCLKYVFIMVLCVFELSWFDYIEKEMTRLFMRYFDLLTQAGVIQDCANIKENICKCKYDKMKLCRSVF